MDPGFFLGGRAPTPKVGVFTYYLTNILQKLAPTPPRVRQLVTSSPFPTQNSQMYTEADWLKIFKLKK